MPTPQDIAAFRYEITESLQLATGYLYSCSDVMNDLLKKIEGLAADDPATYRILMCNKVVPPDPSLGTSDQRNIFFRYDLEKNIFYMERTGTDPEIKDGITSFEHDVYFFPQAAFITVKNDYQALDEWLATGKEPETKVRSVLGNLPNFINDNDGLPFVLSPSHTKPIIK